MPARALQWRVYDIAIARVLAAVRPRHQMTLPEQALTGCHVGLLPTAASRAGRIDYADDKHAS